MVRVLVIVLVVLAFVSVAAFVRHSERRRRERWGEAARRLGASFDPSAGPWYARGARLEAHLDGIAVVVDRIHDGNDAFTRVRCDVANVDELTLHVAPKGLVQRAAVALGAQDVETGDAAFDDQWVVRTNDPERARAFLTPSVRARVMAAGATSYELSGGELSTSSTQAESDVDALVALVEATAAVGRRGAALRRAWEEVAREENGTVEGVEGGRLRIQIEDSVPLRIERTAARRPSTVVVARRLEARPEPFAVDEGGALRSDRPDVTRRRMARLEGRLEALGPYRIEADEDELTLDVTDLEGDVDRMREAAALARLLALPVPDDPYR